MGSDALGHDSPAAQNQPRGSVGVVTVAILRLLAEFSSVLRNSALSSSEASQKV